MLFKLSVLNVTQEHIVLWDVKRLTVEKVVLARDDLRKDDLD